MLAGTGFQYGIMLGESVQSIGMALPLPLGEVAAHRAAGEGKEAPIPLSVTALRRRQLPQRGSQGVCRYPSGHFGAVPARNGSRALREEIGFAAF